LRAASIRKASGYAAHASSKSVQSAIDDQIRAGVKLDAGLAHDSLMNGNPPADLFYMVSPKPN
jgi:hypothetical protein